MKWKWWKLKFIYNLMRINMTVMQLLWNVFQSAMKAWIEDDPDVNQARLASLFKGEIEKVVAGAEAAGTTTTP